MTRTPAQRKRERVRWSANAGERRDDLLHSFLKVRISLKCWFAEEESITSQKIFQRKKEVRYSRGRGGSSLNFFKITRREKRRTRP